MMTELNNTSDCKNCRARLADLLLDAKYASGHPELRAHLNACTACRTELAELHSTFALLDEFSAPEPSPYFDSKLHARLREAQAAEPEGFWERVRSFLLFSTGRSFRPAVTGALAIALIAGGAGVVSVHGIHPGSSPAPSSAVNDLKVLDNNESAEQQMGQLLDVSGDEDGEGQPTGGV